MIKKINKFLLYLSNNEDIPKKKWREDEIKFDIWFMCTLFVSMGLALICWITGVCLRAYALMHANDAVSQVGAILLDSGWIFIAVIFFIEAYDSLRHNRPWSD